MSVVQCHFEIKSKISQLPLYPNITEWHMGVLNYTRVCPFKNCSFSNYQLKDYLRHLINMHHTAIIFTCPDCGVGFAARITVNFHRQSVGYNCSEL